MPTQHPPKASSIAGKTNEHQCQYETKNNWRKHKDKSCFLGKNKTEFLKLWNKYRRGRNDPMLLLHFNIETRLPVRNLLT